MAIDRVNSLNQSDHGCIVGPAAQEDRRGKPYEPVDCSFTDELESAAVRKIRLFLTFLGPKGSVTVGPAVIKDLHGNREGEWLILDSGEEIRIDHIQQLRLSLD